MRELQLQEKLQDLASKCYDLTQELENLQEVDLLNEVYPDNIGAGYIIEHQLKKSLKKMSKAYFELAALAKIV